MSRPSQAPTADRAAGAAAVDERTARRVAEEAREVEWRLPSFGKNLFMGDLRMDLVHPHPRPSPEAAEKGEAFLTRLREFCADHVDSQRI
ncbi:MAG TPA: acyl-CoA dehydrogenase, partial [Thermomonospora sp.]|nr:acyl-CoA dehydrogenase [Thermomonospora sp.]